MIYDFLNSLSDEDIINFIEGEFNSPFIEEKSTEEYMTFCTEICHEFGDSYNLICFRSNHLFYCRTHCGKIGSLLDLTIRNKGCSEEQAIDIIYNFFNLKRDGIIIGLGARKESTYKKRELSDVEYSLLEVPDKPYIHRIFSKLHITAWDNENISQKTLDKYEIYYDIDENRIIIPHFCWKRRKKVVGIRVRNLNTDVVEKRGKYIPLYYNDVSYKHKLSKNLYGLNFTKKFIQKKKKVVVFEGEKSVQQMDTMYGEHNFSVATCGSNFSLEQKKILIDLGVKEITIAYDKQFKLVGDSDYISWKEKIIKMTKDLIDVVDVYVMWDTEGLLEYKDSPSDKGKDIFEKLYKNKIRLEDFMRE